MKRDAASGIGRAQQDPAWIRWTLIVLAVAVVAILVIVPVVNIFV